MKPIFEPERILIKEKTGVDLPVNCWRKVSKIYLDPTCSKPIYTFKVEDHKMTIKKDNTKLFEDYKQKSLEELFVANAERLKQLEEESVEMLLQYIIEHSNEKFVISHSTGKDSVLAYEIWKQAFKQLEEQYPDIHKNIDYEVAFFNTTNESADTYKFIKKNVPKKDLKIVNPDMGFYQWLKNVKNYFIPSVFVRNCCEKFKEGQMFTEYDGDCPVSTITGLRKHESRKRKNYEFMMDKEARIRIHGITNIPHNITTVAPAIEWTDVDVWLYIVKNNIKINDQYYYGFNRVGCLICPYSHNYIDLLTEKYYPTHWNRWLDLLAKNYKIYGIHNRLKWTLEEWQAGRWKEGKSKEQKIITKSPTEKNVKELAEVKGISEELAKKYFKKKCDCGKSLNPTEISMSLKFYGRNITEGSMQCKKCFCKANGMKKDEYNERIIEFTDQGCNLF